MSSGASACNSTVFELFLKELSEQNPKETKIVVVDNAAFHKAKKLVIPNNIKSLYQPPYSPEVVDYISNQSLKLTDKLVKVNYC